MDSTMILLEGVANIGPLFTRRNRDMIASICTIPIFSQYNTPGLNIIGMKSSHQLETCWSIDIKLCSSELLNGRSMHGLVRATRKHRRSFKSYKAQSVLDVLRNYPFTHALQEYSSIKPQNDSHSTSCCSPYM
ncbi:hypothetical protein LOTGIDRAFT_160288 [Lottia gigantea]|uniref:Uncharacterized protein n=1 Tax=Lottia gigantea TaxID=225164 RepID=V3ZW48_LOTGI|nr:hypothetical protein LOTGIDRAFT_160288 [Lottia gigantea]ESO95743.1 hypothetical protein LOTGIDRAFT_160288 [Lottia gigantea]